MKVFKFGGASTSTIERINMVMDILGDYSQEKILVVISAMGKFTNALEKVAEAFYAGQQEEALRLFAEIKQYHLELTRQLVTAGYDDTYARMLDIFTEVEWLLHDKPVRGYDYYYDQIVCSGELLASVIISAALTERSLPNKWIDVRDVLRTDNRFREAAVDMEASYERVRDILLPAFQPNNFLVTQGFIGSTDENESTTLGREGSDYTAALFANLMGAGEVVIWKDVQGVMNADPKSFPDAIFLQQLNYREVVEMAYYGAQVIHPHTIRPVREKNIPLYVKCFLDKRLPGTVIDNRPQQPLPPVIVLKPHQVLLHLQTRDFAFAGGSPAATLYTLLAGFRIQASLIQTEAVGVRVCIDDNAAKIEQLALAAAAEFEVQVEKGLTLLTIRHYTEDLLQQLSPGRQILLRQQSPETVQLLMTDNA